MEQPKQINNTSERLVDDLKSRLSTQSRISIAAASFSIYAFEAMKAELEKVEKVRFIFTSPTFVADKTKKEKREFYIPKLNRERNLYGTEFEIKLRNQLSQKAIAKECAAWIRKKVKFKSNSSQEGMGGFLHLCDGEPSALPVFDMNAPSKQHVYLPFDDFSTTQLGCEKGNNVYTMVNVLPSPSAEAYLQIFNQQWENDEKFKDVTARVLEYIETVYQENAPEYIYFIALYNIFHEFLKIFQKMFFRMSVPASRTASSGTSYTTSRRMRHSPSSTSWRNTTAVFLPTVWDWERPLQRLPSSSITRTATRVCWCFARKS